MGKGTFTGFDTKHLALQGAPRIFSRFWTPIAGGGLNQVVNGGGEEGTLGAQATGWLLAGGNALAVADDEKKFGNRSLKIVNAVAADSFSLQTFSVLKDRLYEVSGWIRTTALPAADAGFGALLNADVNIGSMTVVERSGNRSPFNPTQADVGLAADGVAHDWTYVWSRFRVSVDATLTLYCQLGHGGTQSGTAWFDGVRFRQLDEAPFSRDFSTGPVQQAIGTKLTYLEQIGGSTQTVQPERGSSTIGQFTLRLQDANDEVTRYCANPKVKLGVAMSSGSPADGGNVEAKAGEDVSGYPVPGTLLIGAERVRYATVNVGSRLFQGITRGADGTTAAAHAIDDLLHNGEQILPGIRAQVWVGYDGLDEEMFLALHKMQVYERRLTDDGLAWELVIADIQRSTKRRIFGSATQNKPIILYGNKVTSALKVLLTTSAGGNTKYDRGDGEGLGIPEAFVDVDGLEALATSFGSQKYRLVESGPQDGKAWLEEQIWKTLNCYPMILPDGRYSAIRYAPAPAAASQPLLDATNTIGLPRYRPGDRLIINVVEMWYDWDHVAGTFMTRQVYEETASIGRYGRQPPLVIEDRGLASDLGAQAIADDRANRIFARYADPPPVLEVAGFWDHLVRDVGDIVRMTESRLPNLGTGLRGLTNQVMEVTDISPAFPFSPGAVAHVRMTLLHTGAITVPAPATGIISAPVAIPSPTRYLVEAIPVRNDGLKAKYDGLTSLWVGRYRLNAGTPTSGALPVGVWTRPAFSHKIDPSTGPDILF